MTFIQPHEDPFGFTQANKFNKFCDIYALLVPCTSNATAVPLYIMKQIISLYKDLDIKIHIQCLTMYKAQNYTTEDWDKVVVFLKQNSSFLITVL